MVLSWYRYRYRYRYMYIKYIGTGIGRGNSVMKGITENRPCGAFRPAGNGESLPGGILPLKKRELRGPPGTIYGIRRGNISSWECNDNENSVTWPNGIA